MRRGPAGELRSFRERGPAAWPGSIITRRWVCPEQVWRLDEISQGPTSDPRLPAGRWLAGAAAVALIAVITTLVLSGGGRHAVSAPRGPTALAAPGPSPTGAPGTVLLTCDSANPGQQLGPDWRAGSLRAGPLWLVAGRQLGYAHYGSWPGADRAVHRDGRLHFVVMIVAVMTGSTVVMKPAAVARSYFRFVGWLRPGCRLSVARRGYRIHLCRMPTRGLRAQRPGDRVLPGLFHRDRPGSPGRGSAISDSSPNRDDLHMPGQRMWHNRMTNQVGVHPDHGNLLRNQRWSRQLWNLGQLRGAVER